MASSHTFKEIIPQYFSQYLEHVKLSTNWEDITCPICLDFPHNVVLLQCSSYEQGCRPFMCNTDHMHSNCLDRFKTANGLSVSSDDHSTSDAKVQPTCPLCRGEVTGWIVVEEARMHLNAKNRFCQGENCNFVGNYFELDKHAKLKHPHARPTGVDPIRQLDWDNFQQSSEIIDVLSTIHSEVPRGVVLGDYVIEYGETDTADEYEDFPGDDGNWWNSCLLYQVFDSLRASRNRRRSRVRETRRANRHSSHDASNSDDGSVSSVDIAEYRMDMIDDEYVSRGAALRGSSSHRSAQRRRSRFSDH